MPRRRFVINCTTIEIRDDILAELWELCKEPHEHPEGMNECSICDKDLFEDVRDKLKAALNASSVVQCPPRIKELIANKINEYAFRCENASDEDDAIDAASALTSMEDLKRLIEELETVH